MLVLQEYKQFLFKLETFDPPFGSENYPKDVCPSNKIACNPTLFGENLCSPFTTSNDKNNDRKC